MKTRQEIFLRLVFLFCKFTIAHLGVTLFLLANLGADPFNVFVQGLNHLMRGFNLTYGIIHMCISLMIILVLLLTDRSYIKAGTIICTFYGGSIIDFFMFLLEGLEIQSM